MAFLFQALAVSQNFFNQNLKQIFYGFIKMNVVNEVMLRLAINKYELC